MIEAMVLEISSQSLKDLGVQWDVTKNVGSGNFIGRHLDNDNLKIGQIVPSGVGVPQLDFSVTNAFREFNVRLKAMVQEGAAEVLSRPSVLTLDNRMAYINVSEKIPIANTKFVKDYVPPYPLESRTRKRRSSTRLATSSSQALQRSPFVR